MDAPGGTAADGPDPKPDRDLAAGAVTPDTATGDARFQRPVAEGNEADELPAAFRLNRVYETHAPARSPLTDWRWLLLLALLLGAGLGAGYLIGLHASVPGPGVKRGLYLHDPRRVAGPIDPQTLAEVDAAFDSAKHGRYVEASQRFGVLRDKHPEWPSMGVEVARAYLGEPNILEAQRVLTILTETPVTPDADFVLAQLQMYTQNPAKAEASFATAAGFDPTRADFFFFWGECLRREGKPNEAVGRFRSALLRNRYEIAEGMFRLKLWLAEIQADREDTDGIDKEIDAALAQSRPPYEALFAAAARCFKGHRYEQAAGFITQAQAVTAPAVFRLVLQDPTFTEQSARPEVAGFYR